MILEHRAKEAFSQTIQLMARFMEEQTGHSDRRGPDVGGGFPGGQ